MVDIQALIAMPPSGDITKCMYSVGDRVTCETPDGETETGVVIAADNFEWGNSYVVQVVPVEEGDDGLREVGEEQIVAVAE